MTWTHAAPQHFQLLVVNHSASITVPMDFSMIAVLIIVVHGKLPLDHGGAEFL
jgi:hypothetical protein